MQSDGLFFVGILAFFFILWFVSGGPMKPISFAGPYITPVTNANTVQSGYGAGATTKTSASTGSPLVQIQNIQNSVAQLQRNASTVRAFGQASPYQGQVKVTSQGNASATDPAKEYVIIRNNGKEPIDITGWTISSSANALSERIPRGALIPSKGSVNDMSDIMLAPGDQAFVHTGESPLGISFRENMCIGYLGQDQAFYPSLSNSCPSARDEFDRFYVGNEYRDDVCYQRIQSTPLCKTPDDTGRISSYCLNLIDNYLSYNGCVQNHKLDVRFAGTTWHIYLQHENNDGDSVEMWKSSHEAIKLLDKDGKTVDLYTRDRLLKRELLYQLSYGRRTFRY